jgi:hypothetical protein
MTDFGKLVVAGVVVLVLLAGTGVYFLHQRLSMPSPVACTMEAKQCPDGSYVGRGGPDCSFAPCPTVAVNLDAAVYPLYSSATWQSATPLTMLVGTSSSSGYQSVSVESATTSNIASTSTPFVTYYDKKLTKLGWKEDKTLAADGAGSSQRVYKKGAAVIVVGYTSNFEALSEDQPAQCPCTVSFSLFTTATSSPNTP